MPDSASAGEETAISTTGSGKATFYLVGPGVSRKSEVALGEEIHLTAQDVRDCRPLSRGSLLRHLSQRSFLRERREARQSELYRSSLARPCRQNDAVSGVAFPFDQYRNLVLTPVSVNFQLTAKDTSLFSRSVRTQNGVAWFRTTSGKSAGRSTSYGLSG